MKKLSSFWENIKYAIGIVLNIAKLKSALIIILSILCGFFPSLLLWLNQTILNGIQNRTQSIKNLIAVIMIFFVATTLFTVIRGINAYFMNELSFKLMYRINERIMKKCGDLSLQELEKAETYDQINRLEQGVAAKPYQVLQTVLAIVTSLTSLISASIIVIQQNAWIECVLLLISIAAACGNVRVGNKEFTIHYERSETERKSWYISYLLTHDTYFKEIKENALSKYFLRKYEIYAATFIKQENYIEKKREVLGIIISVIQDFVSLLLMIRTSIAAYEGALLIGTAVAFLSAISIVQTSTNEIAGSIYSIYNATLYLNLLSAFLGKVEEKRSGKNIRHITQLSLNKVSYNYPHHPDALKEASLKLDKGDQIAIVGQNGSGKSTLFKMLAGLYCPSEGKIIVNNTEDRKDINIDLYREKISALFQDFMKYEGSLEENITLGDIKKEKCQASIKTALRLADVDFLKENEEYKLNCNIGNWFENGAQISGGQWQKIALARAYYKDADVYMLDEPSSSLDVVAESKVFHNFFQLSKNKIGIYITHRVRIAQRAPRIIVMDQGHIIAEGNHEKLYQECSLYRKMFENEMKEGVE